MNERIHGALDGATPREDLTVEEAAELTEYTEMIHSALAAVEPERECDLATTVMRRVEEAEAQSSACADSGPGLLRGALEWLWAPRPVSIAVRPAFGMAAALVLLMAVLIPWDRTARAPVAGELAAPAAPAVYVQFRLDAPRASRVALAGDFTGWRPEHVLYEVAPGVWTTTVPLEPGVHEYAFVIDGERWVADPLAPPVADGFGGTNSRLAVLTPERRRL